MRVRTEAVVCLCRVSRSRFHSSREFPELPIEWVETDPAEAGSLVRGEAGYPAGCGSNRLSCGGDQRHRRPPEDHLQREPQGSGGSHRALVAGAQTSGGVAHAATDGWRAGYSDSPRAGQVPDFGNLQQSHARGESAPSPRAWEWKGYVQVVLQEETLVDCDPSGQGLDLFPDLTLFDGVRLAR